MIYIIMFLALYIVMGLHKRCMIESIDKDRRFMDIEVEIERRIGHASASHS
jgi:hypothetical protein